MSLSFSHKTLKQHQLVSNWSGNWGKDTHWIVHYNSSSRSTPGICAVPSWDARLPQSLCMTERGVQPPFRDLAGSHKDVLGRTSPLSRHGSTLLPCSGLEKGVSHHLETEHRATT